MPFPALTKILPCVTWLKTYNKEVFTSDLVAALIVTIMLIPQSLAYALLAGLPAETGLYASILPLVAYAVFGTSRTLSVGPVAVISLMTAAAIQNVAADNAITASTAAVLLALFSGMCLLMLGVFRFGFLTNFISHPVVAGFITASALIIALGQLKHLTGIPVAGDNLPDLLTSLSRNRRQLNISTLMLGGSTLVFLLWARFAAVPLLKRLGLNAYYAGLLGKTAPVLAVIGTALLAAQLQLQDRGIRLVGNIPSGLPSLQLPLFNLTIAGSLLLPAILISIIGYVETVSVGKTLGAKRQQKIDPDSELIALGAANLTAAFSGGFPVTGGFSRSVVNFEAGAQTPAAGILTAIGIAVATLLFTDYLAWLPNATLAATIIVAVLGLVDFTILRQTWNYSRSDFIAVTMTMGLTLLAGVEIGITCGVLASLLLHLHKTSRPHIAEVGEIAGTGHFRNVLRHEVVTHPGILSLRVDESLYFANASYIEDLIYRTLQQRKEIRHVVLMCSAVNTIDISALDVLQAINSRLLQLGIGFHLSEVKGPVLDALQTTEFLGQLNGQVFLTQQQAVQTLLGQYLPSGQMRSDFQDYQI
jgi:SulP family sulfate permease